MKPVWFTLCVCVVINSTHGSPLKRNSANDPETASPLEEVGGYYEGDIVLTTEQKNLMKLGYTSLIGQWYKWPNGIVPYKINATAFTTVQQNSIVAALREIELVSCIRYVPRTTEADYILVTGEKTDCHSFYGRLGLMQKLNLHPDGCMSRGTIIHEFLHALGFVHMQSASDRDFYVQINWDAIPADKKSNFKGYNATRIDDFGIPYDYDSVMHYAPTAFGINNQQTIIPIKPGVKIGQRNGLSYKDIKRINYLYPNCY